MGLLMTLEKEMQFLGTECSDQAMKMQEDLCLFFIDYTKTYDRVQHKKLFEILEKLDIHKLSKP